VKNEKPVLTANGSSRKKTKEGKKGSAKVGGLVEEWGDFHLGGENLKTRMWGTKKVGRI